MRAIKGNVIIRMNVLQKTKYALTDECVIEIVKGFDFNLRQDRASFGYIIDGEGFKEGAEVVCHYLALEPNYLVEGENILTEIEKRNGYKVLSIPYDMCFAINEGNGWTPCKDFLLTQRIFLPYNGKLTGIEHQLVKNRMFVVSGFDEEGEIDLSGKCVVTLENSDYEIIWHNSKSREERLIRTRGREITAIDEGLTRKIKTGKYLIGLAPNNCKTLN